MSIFLWFYSFLLAILPVMNNAELGGSWEAIRTALLEIDECFANPDNRIKHIANLRPYRRS